MNVYWFIGLLTIFLHKILPHDNNKNYLYNLIIAFFPLFIYGAIRVNYGNDYPAYESIFNVFHNLSTFIPDEKAHAEIGYQYLCYIMPSYRSILVLNAFILMISFVFFIHKNIPSKYAWLAIFLIFLMPEKNIFGSLVGIRNGLVVTSFILTFTFVQERKPVYLFTTALILSTIHTSAIVYLPLAYLIARNTPVTKKEIYVWILTAIILMVMSMSLLTKLLLPIFSIVADRYEEALMKIEDSDPRGLLNYGANLIMMFIFLYFAYKKNDELLPQQNSLFRMAALYCISGCLGVISGRMTYYYAIYYIGGIVLMYSMEWNNYYLKQAMLFFVILIASYGTFIVWMGSSWWNHDTYHSLLENFILFY